MTRKSLLIKWFTECVCCAWQDVMSYLLEVEARHQRRHNYLTTHPSVNQRTRAILVNWLIQVQVIIHFLKLG